jgi:hypothetical protein
MRYLHNHAPARISSPTSAEAVTKHPRFAITMVAGVVALVFGGLVGWQPPLFSVVVICGLAFVLAALLLSDEALIVLVVGATFLSRLAVDISGINVRPEHVVSGMLILRFLIRPPTMGSHIRRRLAPILLILLLWNFVATALMAPSVAKSATILGWLALDYAALLALTGYGRHKALALRAGSIFAILNAFCAVLAYSLAGLGGPQFGVQVDPAYGGFAAYVFSYEANILAVFLALWGIIIALGYSGLSRIWVAVSYIIFPCALIATQTRAAVLAYIIGILLIAATRGIRTMASVAAATLVMSGLIIAVLPSAPASVQATVGKMSQLTNLTTGTGQDRTSSWKLALGDLSSPQEWVLGLGTNTYGQRHNDLTQPKLDLPSYLGNLPLTVLYDTGIVGVFLFAWFCVAVYRFALIRSQSRVAILPLSVAYLVTSLATSSFWLLGTWIFIYFAVAERDTVGPAAVEPSSAELHHAS